METKLTRKAFLEFFLLGGLISLFKRKVNAGPPKEKEALFWRKKSER